MKRSFAFVLITALALCASQVSQAAEKKNPEANRLAREGAEAAKNQDFDKAVDLLRKATAMDHKYADELSAVYQQRGYAAATDQRYGDAVNDYGAALKLTPQNSRLYEQRAAAAMKIQDYEKALAGAPGCSVSSGALGTAVNFRLRRFAGRGASVIVMLRPVILGSISTCDMPERSSRTFSTSCIPNS